MMIILNIYIMNVIHLRRLNNDSSLKKKKKKAHKLSQVCDSVLEQ